MHIHIHISIHTACDELAQIMLAFGMCVHAVRVCTKCIFFRLKAAEHCRGVVRRIIAILSIRLFCRVRDAHLALVVFGCWHPRSYTVIRLGSLQAWQLYGVQGNIYQRGEISTQHTHATRGNDEAEWCASQARVPPKWYVRKQFIWMPRKIR